MKTIDAAKRKFSNNRQWREFIAAIQCSVPYPQLVNALRGVKVSEPAAVWLTLGRP